jgi:polar amino acid transport system substrate-binding protein
MKQVLQSYRTGELRVAEVPAPTPLPGAVLVRTRASLVSSGTERMVMELAKKSLLGKAADRPDLVKKVADKLARDGIVATAKAVLGKLDQPIPLGYSAAGVVIDRGTGAEAFNPGDRVACAGAKLANHAEVNAVPLQLCVPVPAEVSDEAAAFATVGAIAMQGIRTAKLGLGERVAVVGLGLIGQLAVQLCKAQGCRVLGVDLDTKKVELAKTLGADAALVRSGPVLDEVARLTQGRGVDAVLICAAAESDDPIQLAGEMARDRGRVVVVGAVPMNVPRRPYYDKELSLLQSRSYGPGRYDALYEGEGVDYPFGYVRWTEGRNLAAFIELCALGQVKTAPLVTHRFPIARAEEAYQLISGESEEPFLGVLLTYPEIEDAPARSVEVTPTLSTRKPGALRLSLVGSGSFAAGVLAPELARRRDLRLQTVVSARGVSARHLAERFGFERCSTDDGTALVDPGVEAVVIATRHDLHAAQAARALRAGKAVFVEKPLALDREGLAQVVRAAKESGRPLFVDFNRRFAPLAQKLRDRLADRKQPAVILYRVNAGPIPLDSWIHDPEVGGGRIVGEVCHFIDLCAALTGAEVVRVHCESVSGARAPLRNDDQVVLSLKLSDGSVASVVYASGGDPSQAKERIEVLCDGLSAVLDDFQTLEMVRDGKAARSIRLLKDKGHRAALDAFIDSAHSGVSTFSLRSLAATTLATFAAVEALQTGVAIDLKAEVDRLLETVA